VALVATQSQNAAARPTVWVLSTGGTIAGTGSSPTDLSNYKAGTLQGQALVDAVPQIKQIADVKVEQVANLVSSDITLDIWLKLAQRINRILADDPAVAGVLVGSMRPATAISADGPLNLLNAVRTAIARDARGKGALVVMNDPARQGPDNSSQRALEPATSVSTG
jgi:L-asparaginase